MSDDKVKEIEERLAALKKQWPAHSVPPAMLQQLDDLEDELEEAKKKQGKKSGN